MAPSILPAIILSSVLVALNAVPVTVATATPNVALTKAFISTSGWTGGDAAYSVALTRRRSLWLFGDSFIGNISNGARCRMDMVHNTAGWLDESDNGTMKFRYFYPQKNGQPISLLAPSDSKSYYWPSAMALLEGGKLALFQKVIVSKPGDDTGFGFDWVAQELTLVENANAQPTSWRYHRIKLPGGEANIMPGSACMVEGEYTYVYGTLKSGDSHPAVLMRIPSADLARGDISRFEYWTAQSAWSRVPLDPATLFQGAPEMSVSRISGLPGFWAVYTENGLSARIMLRHADRPEGPWSDASVIYNCPEAVRDPKLACYGAKHHPELAHQPRTLVITYCLNPGGMSAHRSQPFAYFPKAVTITLSPKPAT
jgi:hypothetical protein